MTDEQILSFLQALLMDGTPDQLLFRVAGLAILARVVWPVLAYVKGKRNGGTTTDKVLGKLDEILAANNAQAAAFRSFETSAGYAIRESARAHTAHAEALKELAAAARENNRLADRILTRLEAARDK